MRSTSLAVLAILSIVAICEFATCDEYSLEYRYRQRQSQEGVHGTGARMEVLDSAPKGVTLPASAGSEAVFCKWKTPMVKDGFIYIAFAKSGKNLWRDRIVVDTDCDGDLSDESPAEAFLTQGKMDFSHYGPIEVKFPTPDGTMSYHATFSLYAGIPSQKVAWIRPSCWHEGHLSIDGVTYPVALVDGNANGAFDDTSNDLDKVDFLAFPSAEQCVHRCLGKYLSVGGKLLNLKAARDGSSIDITPAEKVPSGTVRTKGLVTSMTLAGENGEVPLTLTENRVEVPAGKWIVKEWFYEGNSSEGRAPAFGEYSFGTEASVTVAEGKEAEVDIGASAKATADLTKATKLGAFGEPSGGGPPVIGRASRVGRGVVSSGGGGSGGGSSGGG